MDTLPIWTWWVIAPLLLLFSPVFAFLSALLVEILLGIVKEGGVPALSTLMAATLTFGLLLRRRWRRPSANTIVKDQA
jgi:hypothetical protein